MTSVSYQVVSPLLLISMRGLNSCLIITILQTEYEDLVWVQKLPPNYPQSDVNQQISHKIKELEPTHLTKKTTVASEIDNGHKFVTISNPCCLGSQQMKQKIRQAYEKQKENALTDNLELYFLLELMFTVREHPDRLKVLETIWCQNDCLYLRHNHFIAISTAWAEEVILIYNIILLTKTLF